MGICTYSNSLIFSGSFPNPCSPCDLPSVLLPGHTEHPDNCVHTYWVPTFLLPPNWFQTLGYKIIHTQHPLQQDLPVSSMHMWGLGVMLTWTPL